MATIPDVKTTVRDGALGIVPANTSGVQAKIGTSSLGTTNTVYSISDMQTLKDTLGTGPLVEAAAIALKEGGGPVMCVRAPGSTAGAMGAITAVKTGTATLAVTGAALDAYLLRVEIITGGATLVAGTATFRYSLDNGRTWSGELALPTSGVYAIPNTGLTLTWTYTSGTAFVAGDYWTGTGTGPSFTLSEAMTALDALLADTSDFALVHIVGAPATAGDAATMFAAFAAKLEGAATTLYRYTRGIMEVPEDTDANLKTAFASVASTRIMVGAGFHSLISPISSTAFLRSAAWSVSARISKVAPGADVGETVTPGPLVGVVALSRDENKTAGLDAARFSTLRTITGTQGAYITNGRLMSPTGSDFQYIQHGRVMDIGSKTVRLGALRFLNTSVRVSSTTGRIDERDAVAIETALESQLRATLGANVSDVSVQVDRTTNILSTSTLFIRHRIVPLGYVKFIEQEIGFRNPALQQVAAAA